MSEQPSFGKRKAVWIGAGVAAVAVVVVATGIYPPSDGNTSGAIVPAQRFRAEQPMSGDVKGGSTDAAARAQDSIGPGSGDAMRDGRVVDGMMTDGRVDSRSDSLKDGKADSLRDGKTDGKIDGRVDSRSDSLKDGKADSLRDGKTDGKIDGRVDSRSDSLKDGKADSLRDGKTDGKIDGRADSKVDGKYNGKVDGRTDGKTDGRTDAAKSDARTQ